LYIICLVLINNIDVNSKQIDYCPFVNFKTKAKYFTSRRSQFDKITFSSYNELLKEITKYENGLSRIYKVSLEKILQIK